MPGRGGLSRNAFSRFEIALPRKTAENSLSLNKRSATGQTRSSAREATIVASNPRRLRDEDLHIFIVPP